MSNCRNDKKPDFVPFNHTLKLPNCRELLGRKVRLLWTKDDTEVYFRIQVHMEISQFAGKFRFILQNFLKLPSKLFSKLSVKLSTKLSLIVNKIVPEILLKLSMKLYLNCPLRSSTKWSMKLSWNCLKIVRPNCEAELLLFGSAQMTELFSAEHRSFSYISFNH